MRPLKDVLVGGAWLSGANMITGAISLAQVAVLGYVLSQYEYGYFRYVISLLGLLSVFTVPGMTTAVYRTFAKNESTSIVKTTLARIGVGFIGSLFLLGIVYLSIGDQQVHFHDGVLLAIFFPFLESLTTYEAVLLAKRQYRSLATITVLQRLANAVTIILIAIFVGSLTAIIFAHVLTVVLFRIIALARVLRTQPGPGNAVTVRKDIFYGLKLTVAQSPGIAGSFLDKIFVFQVMGAELLAIYSMATIFADQLKSLIKHLGSIETGNLVHLRAEEALAYVHQQMRRVTLLVIPLYLAYAAGIIALFSVFSKYRAAIGYGLLYGLVLFLSPKTYYRSYLEAHGQVKAIGRFYAWATAFEVFFAILLFRGLGLAGIILSALLSEALTWLLLRRTVEDIVRRQALE